MIDTYFNAVSELATITGDFAFTHYRQSLVVDVKGDGSPVTIADRGAEERARAWIAQRFPEDGIVGEEFGTVRPDAKRRWIIDPIDGTKSFIRSVPLWGSLVAVCEGDDVLAGCIYCPAIGELVVAAAGKGAFFNGSRCYVSPIDTLSNSAVLITDDRFLERPERGDAWQELAAEAAVVRTWGDCYGYVLVATGRAEVMVDDVTSPWDAAALYPIITEAGGVFTSWKGQKTAFGGDVIATNAGVAQETRNILMEIGG